MKKLLFTVMLLFAFACLGIMLYYAAKGKTEWAVCWGVFSIWNYITSTLYLKPDDK